MMNRNTHNRHAQNRHAQYALNAHNARIEMDKSKHAQNIGTRSTIYKYIIDTDIGADYENINHIHTRWVQNAPTRK